MSESPAAARQFKFVGGPSRKRRRHADRYGQALLDFGNRRCTRSSKARCKTQGIDKPGSTSTPTSDAGLDRLAQTQDTWDEAATVAPVMLTPGLADVMGMEDIPGWLGGSSTMDQSIDYTGNVGSSSLFEGQLPFISANAIPSFEDEVNPTSITSFEPESFTPDAQTGSGKSISSPLLASPTLQRPSEIKSVVAKLFTRYDQEFCLMPITRDFEANPFRFKLESSSQLLRHSILALCYKHLYRETGSCLDQAIAHKSQALNIIQRGNTPKDESSHLDANMVLMALDTANSAYGPWTSYLNRAKRILEATQRVDTPITPRIQAHISMLAWWDITLALTSRRGGILPESSILSLLESSSSSDGNASTIWNVSGCPEDLFRAMIKLSQYAHELETTVDMTCVDFNMGPVLAVERDIRGWNNAQYRDPLSQGLLDIEILHCDADGIGHRLDLHHCAEAWRYGLLIYIERIFKWSRSGPLSPIIGLLARKTLNHVSACRRSTMMQKQVLLPVLLAGSETDDKSLRAEAKEYCDWWDKRTGYNMFSSAGSVLEEVWAGEDLGVWWGSVIDGKTQGFGTNETASQFLFG